MAIIEKEYLGLAAEYAVASQLCRNDMYAQLTLGTRKQTDLLIQTGTGVLLRIQVKAKQGKVWPNCKGIWGEDMVLVLVDFEGKQDTERPDFYVLTSGDWVTLVKTVQADRIATGEVIIGNQNQPVFVRNIDRKGRPCEGMGVSVSQVKTHREAWDKIKAMRSNR